MPVKKAENDLRKKLVIATLRLATTEPWEKITLPRISKAAKIKGEEAQKIFPDVQALLPALVDYVDKEAERRLAEEPNGDAQEQLFDWLMSRFEVLQEHREAFLALTRSARRDPSLAQNLGRALWKSFLDKQKRIKGSPKAFSAPFEAATWLIIYLYAFRVWEKDSSPDMAKTMVSLDKALKTSWILTQKLDRFVTGIS